MSNFVKPHFPSRRLLLAGVLHLVNEHDQGCTRTWCKILTSAGELVKGTDADDVCPVCALAVDACGNGAVGYAGKTGNKANVRTLPSTKGQRGSASQRKLSD